MARGWESKSVEQQQEEARSSRSPKTAPLTKQQRNAQQRRRGLELSRQRVLDQLKLASNSHHRTMLESALADLNAQLAREDASSHK
jgi:signal recognition particle GTPase